MTAKRQRLLAKIAMTAVVGACAAAGSAPAVAATTPAVAAVAATTTQAVPLTHLYG